MLEDDAVPHRHAAGLALEIGGRRVITPLVRICVEKDRGLPPPVLDRICELGAIAAKALLASLRKATPLGRYIAAGMLSKIGVRDERIFEILREQFDDKEHWPRIVGAIGRYGDRRFVPPLIARIETFDWRRDTPNRCQAGPLDDLIQALYACGGTLPKRLRTHVLDQFVDDQIGRALSRVRDGDEFWEREMDRIDDDEEARRAFARRFTWWAQPVLSLAQDPRAYSEIVWDLGCLWATAFRVRGEPAGDDISSELLRRHQRLFAEYHTIGKSKRTW
jgi:hypothetical protein